MRFLFHARLPADLSPDADANGAVKSKNGFRRSPFFVVYCVDFGKQK